MKLNLRLKTTCEQRPIVHSPMGGLYRHVGLYFTPLTRQPLSLIIIFVQGKYEPEHDKTNKMSVRPAKTQISLGIRPVWSESSLSAWGKLKSLATH